MEMALFAVAAAAFVIGAGLAGCLGWIWGGSRATAGREAREAALRDAEKRASAAAARADELANQARQAEGRAGGLEAALRQADSERAAAAARAEELGRSLTAERELLDGAKAQLGDTFQALAAEALRDNQQGFLALAAERLGSVSQQSSADLEARQKAIETVIGPVRESLEKVDQQIRGIERERGMAYGTLTAEVRALATTHERLRAETGNLVNALRAPAVRGRWGELQLRRVVEMAGMLENCDFEQQTTVMTEDGRLRPDVVVRLPNGRNIVVDAKAPLKGYLEAIEAVTDEERRAKLREHASRCART